MKQQKKKAETRERERENKANKHLWQVDGQTEKRIERGKEGRKGRTEGTEGVGRKEGYFK